MWKDMLKQPVKRPSATVLHLEDSVARGTLPGNRLKSKSGLTILKPSRIVMANPGREVNRDFPKSHLLKFGPFAGRVGVFNFNENKCRALRWGEVDKRVHKS
ncbi:hypothetical protein CDAR_70201 [Caerostris darwini]|uniref:Uncharacterized protein n=1 Tax=Caerostris darwini TaxID=1538125 RepID=A0AAV4TF99_9ARAC|nr:hypothetical protein CDAR_70201 [Caerostris darwini]